jgi:hypothetical protein
MKYKTRKATSKLRALYDEDENEGDMEGGGFFQQLLKSAFTGVADLIVRPRGFDASKVREGWLRRPIDMPPLEDLSKMVASTYDPPSEGGIDSSAIQGYTLIAKTPTLSFFQVDRKRNIIIIALRGTSFSDVSDISADLGIVRGIVSDASTARNVRNSARYRQDVMYIKEIQPLITGYLRIKDPIYYAVGHSLSGAMIDELLEDNLVSSAVSFNPAIERRNFDIPNNNHRVYLECDILYNLLGKFITNGNIEVVKKENPAGPDAGPIDTTKGTVRCHNIKEVIPLMSGKGINNNISHKYKYEEMIGGRSPCDSILQEMTTADYGPNSGRERQMRRYMECRVPSALRRETVEAEPLAFADLIHRPSKNDFRPIGRGPLGDLWDNVVLGKKLISGVAKGFSEHKNRPKGGGMSFTNKELTKIILDKNKVIADLEERAYGGGFFEDLLLPQAYNDKAARKKKACRVCATGDKGPRIGGMDVGWLNPFDTPERAEERKEVREACKVCKEIDWRSD